MAARKDKDIWAGGGTECQTILVACALSVEPTQTAGRGGVHLQSHTAVMRRQEAGDSLTVQSVWTVGCPCETAA